MSSTLNLKKYLSKIIFVLIIAAFVIACAVSADISSAIGSMWSLLPPVVAIGLALITKEVYSSLFIRNTDRRRYLRLRHSLRL